MSKNTEIRRQPLTPTEALNVIQKLRDRIDRLEAILRAGRFQRVWVRRSVIKRHVREPHWRIVPLSR